MTRATHTDQIARTSLLVFAALCPFAPALAHDAISPASPLSAALTFADEPTPPTSSADPAAPPALDAAASGSPAWTVHIQPLLWYAAPSGELRLPTNSGNGPAGFTGDADTIGLNTLDIDRARLRPAGQATLSAGDWLFTFAGTNYEVSRSGVVAPEALRVGAVAVASGQTFDIDFELGLYEVGLGYRLWSKDFAADSTSPSSAVPVVLDLHLVGGVRAYDLTINFERTTAGSGASTAGFDELFIEPYLGARLDASFDHQFSVGLLATVGYLPGDNPGSLSLDIVAGFTWRPHPNIGVLIGYRQLAYDLEKGDGADTFAYDGRLAGLLAGIDIAF